VERVINLKTFRRVRERDKIDWKRLCQVLQVVVGDALTSLF